MCYNDGIIMNTNEILNFPAETRQNGVGMVHIQFLVALKIVIDAKYKFIYFLGHLKHAIPQVGFDH